MDLMKLYSTNPATPTVINAGVTINGYTSIMWIERYSKPGEFKIEAPLSSGLLDLLPIDSFVAQLNSKELMIVENHEIDQSEGEDGVVTISGRSFDSFLEQRLLGDNYASVPNYDIPEFLMPAATTASQIYTLINTHFIATTLPKYAIPSMGLINVTTGTLTSEERTLEYENIYEVVQKLMKIDDLGIRVFRPISNSSVIQFAIQNGVDRSNTVRFSWRTGDISSLRYFSSSKTRKNYVRALGKWVQEIYEGPETGLARRGMFLDTSDVDQQHNAMLTSTALLWCRIVQDVRSKTALAGQKDLHIVQADISEDSPLRFRVDYNIGDLVTVEGDFGVSEVMRVVEYAETEDDTGYSGHPTLSTPGGE